MLNRKYADRKIIDRIYVWFGNTDLLLAAIKHREDQWKEFLPQFRMNQYITMPNTTISQAG
jgi:hypothetical protein